MPSLMKLTIRLFIAAFSLLTVSTIAFSQTSDSSANVTISTVSSSTINLTSPGAPASALTVRVTDPNGNPIPGITVTFGVNQTGCFDDIQCFGPPFGTYGFFSQGLVNVLTDSAGTASATGYFGGNLPGTYDVFAQIEFLASDANAQLIGKAGDVSVFFHIVQAFSTISVRPGITGTWYDPSQSGQGFNFEVISPTQLAVFFYTFDSLGNNIFLEGVGPFDDTTATIPLYTTNGGFFPPNFDPTKISRAYWGQLSVVFTDCNSGSTEWTVNSNYFTSFGDGGLPIKRITSVPGLSCP